MKTLKDKRVIALRQVGVEGKEVERFRKSSNEYLIQYRGSSLKVVSRNILEKIMGLADVRRTIGVEMAGAILIDNLKVIFIFYIDDDEKNAWFEETVFSNIEDFERELERQLRLIDMPENEQKHMIYKNGLEMEIVLF